MRTGWMIKMANGDTPNSLKDVGKPLKRQNRLDRREVGDATRKRMLQAAETEFDVVAFEWITGEPAQAEADRLGVSLNLSVNLDLTGGLL